MGLCVQGDGAGGCCLLGRRLDSLDAACFHGVPKNRSLEAGGLQGAQLVGKGGALVPLLKMGLVRIMSRLDTAFRIITPSPQPELLLMSHHKNTSLGATSTSPEHLQGRRLHIPVPDHPLHEEILPNAQPKPSLEQ